MPNDFARIMADLRDYFDADVPDAVAELIRHCEGLERENAWMRRQMDQANQREVRINARLQQAALIVLRAADEA